MIIQTKNTHIKEIFAIESTHFTNPYTELEIAHMLEDNSYYHIVYLEKEVLGYFGMKQILSECDIMHIAVKENYEGQGIGSQLLFAALDHAKQYGVTKIHLEVRKSNQKAIALYEKYGFLIVGERKDYYIKPMENAILMTREVEQ